MSARVAHGILNQSVALGHEIGGTGPREWALLDRECREMVAAHAIQDDHVEWRGRRPLLLESADVKPLGVRATVYDLVDRPLVAVKRKDHRPVTSEELSKPRLWHPVWMDVTGEECHEVDHVHDPHAEILDVFS